MGYDPGAQGAAPSAEEAALAGSAAGMVTRAIISPFDVLKIRFQVMPSLRYKTKYPINFLHYLLLCSMCCCAEKHCALYFCHSSRLNPCLQGSRRESTGDCSRRSAAFIRRRVSLLFGRATSRHSSSPFATGPSRFV